MNKAKQNYKAKCKKREVVFYIKDNDLYEFSKTINFQQFVKNCLRNKRQIDEMFYNIFNTADYENDTGKEDRKWLEQEFLKQ